MTSSDRAAGARTVSIRPITTRDASAIGEFLTRHLNSSVSPEAWATVIDPPWDVAPPNHGFQLVSGDDIVGVYLAVYSERNGAGLRVRVCNLAAFCVLEDFRMHGLRLVRALLGQKDYDFIDLSPSGNVIGLNERLGFSRLDTSTRLVLNLPRPSRQGLSVTGDPSVLEAVLSDADATIYRDHRQAEGARHVLVQQQRDHAYLMFRRDRRKGLPLFASPIYAGGSRSLLRSAWPSVGSHILLEHRLPATLMERRILGFARGIGVELANPRPKMVRTSKLDPESIDYLYSELTLIEW